MVISWSRRLDLHYCIHHWNRRWSCRASWYYLGSPQVQNQRMFFKEKVYSKLGGKCMCVSFRNDLPSLTIRRFREFSSGFIGDAHPTSHYGVCRSYSTTYNGHTCSYDWLWSNSVRGDAFGLNVLELTLVTNCVIYINERDLVCLHDSNRWLFPHYSGARQEPVNWAENSQGGVHIIIISDGRQSAAFHSTTYVQ